MKKVLLSPWLILCLLVIGWGPLLIDDYIWATRPDLDASYTTQAFAMGWGVGITSFCTAGAIALTMFHRARMVIWLANRYLGRREHSG